MSTERVWNLTDDPTTKVRSSTVMICGLTCLPGRFVLVSGEMLKTAHKLHEDAAKGLVFIGHEPPAAYVSAKKAARAPFREGATRAHGPQTVTQPEVVKTEESQPETNEHSNYKRKPKKSWET